jgi:hypothetical protein
MRHLLLSAALRLRRCRCAARRCFICCTPGTPWRCRSAVLPIRNAMFAALRREHAHRICAIFMAPACGNASCAYPRCHFALPFRALGACRKTPAVPATHLLLAIDGNLFTLRAAAAASSGGWRRRIAGLRGRAATALGGVAGDMWRRCSLALAWQAYAATTAWRVWQTPRTTATRNLQQNAH